MAAQQIPSGNRGARVGVRRAGDCAERPLPGPEHRTRRQDLRLDGPARVKFWFLLPGRAGCRLMSAAVSRHAPVLLREAVSLLEPHAGGTYVDATFGAGG